MAEEQTPGEVWDGKIRAICEYMREATGAGAVMVAVFAAPWMEEKDGFRGTATGIAGRQGIDPRRMARELRETADVLEAQADAMLSGKPFDVSMERSNPAGPG